MDDKRIGLYQNIPNVCMNCNDVETPVLLLDHLKGLDGTKMLGFSFKNNVRSLNMLQRICYSCENMDSNITHS